MKIRNLRIINVFVCLAAFVLAAAPLSGQECGPGCPLCSDSPQAAIMEPGKFLLNVMVIPGGEDETGVLSFKYGLLKWLDLGLGYTLSGKETVWSVRAQLAAEKEDNWMPGVIVGTGSVRIHGGDQSIYFQLTKTMEIRESFALCVYAGLSTLLDDFGDLYFIGGLTLRLKERVSAFLNYDGRNFHPGVSWEAAGWLTLSFFLVESREFAFAAGVRFSLKK